MHSDYPSNSKRGGVCIYYKETLPVRVINVNYWNECVRFELIIGENIDVPTDFPVKHKMNLINSQITLN